MLFCGEKFLSNNERGRVHHVTLLVLLTVDAAAAAAGVGPGENILTSPLPSVILRTKTGFEYLRWD
jgi:hypothetical protein